MTAAFLARTLEKFADLVFPRLCVGCGAHGRYFCARCAPPHPDTTACPVCARDLDDWQIHPLCRKRLPLAKLVALGDYEGPLAKAIAEVKYQFSSSILGELAPIAAPALLPEWRAAEAALVPVPLHPGRQAWRGFNQSAMLAEHLAKLGGLTVATAIQRTRETPPQVGLGASRRRENVTDAFAPNGAAPEHVVLVDDVTTTGSTLGECARVLLANGSKRVDAFVLAHERKKVGG